MLAQGMKYGNSILAFCSFLAIALYFFLKVTDLPLLTSSLPISAPLIVMTFAGLGVLGLQILRKLLKGDLGADSLAIIALVTATILHEYLAAILIILMLSGGETLEAYAMRTASSVLKEMAGRMPATAHRRQAEHLDDIPVMEIAIGDEIVIYPHETAPVDGTVLEGQGSMDEAYLTGEPYRVSKAPGAQVLSGAINGEALLVIRADKLPADSRYANIMSVMQEAEQKRPEIRRLGDQIGAIFAPVALTFALLAWWWSGDEMRFLSVLVVATPCPLLIAIPITIISAISTAARHGIVIKDPTVLERLPTCKTAIFDKTGTLTYGEPELTEIHTAANISRKSILQYAASLERYSKHPLARAILKAAGKERLYLPQATEISERPGQGLTGRVNNKSFQVTHRKKLLQNMPELASALPEVTAGLECIVLQDGKYAATFHFRDAPRSDGKSFISHLAPVHQFTKVMLVSGDRETEVTYLADLLGIEDTLASQSPEQKLEIIRAEVKKAPTLFMGDGINDAPALAAATVGLAFGQHNSITAEAAGAVVLENSLTKVDELIHLSINMRRIAMQSALGGMALSIIAMGFAAAGLITPVAGALFQEVIDILAITNALRLIWGEPPKSDIAS